MRTILFSFVLLFIIDIQLYAQVGLVSVTPDVSDGFVLYESSIYNETYLINKCGEVVNSWQVSNSDNHPKILPNGNLLYMRSNTVFERNWEDETVAIVELNEPGYILEYEVIKLPNDNYLCLGRKFLSPAQFINLGFNLQGVSPDVVDVVLELDKSTGDIVWEWNIADHVIQERDSTVGNFGVVADHPGLLDMDRISDYDWQNYESFMINGMDYNPILDQIVLSIRKISEVVIIDHSTTTEEAAGNTGGIYGRGGDILYRWGNPQNYGRGSAADRFLFYQHNPNWIEHGPHSGKIIIYNNGLNRPNVGYSGTFSEVPIINTPIDNTGMYPLLDGQAFLPETPDQVYSGLSAELNFYSGYTSGGEVLTNGNVFITIGRHRRMIELNQEQEIVWDYTIPGGSYIFRTEKYAADYLGFEGKDMTPAGLAPGTFNSVDCIQILPVEDLNPREEFLFSYLHKDQLEVTRNDQQAFTTDLLDVNGRLLASQTNDYKHQINLESLAPGIYFILCKTKSDIRVKKLFRY